MLLSRAFVDDGALHAGALITAVKSAEQPRARSATASCWRRLVGVAGTLIGLIFAFTVERVRLGADG